MGFRAPGSAARSRTTGLASLGFSGVEELLDETRLLFHRLVEAGEKLHRDEPVTIGMRGVLEYLVRNGAATVPDIARARFVTRQHIQTLVNALLEQGLVVLEDNPLHKRSPLATLTEEGGRVIRRIRKREAKVFQTIDADISNKDLNTTIKTLRYVRDALPATRRMP